MTRTHWGQNFLRDPRYLGKMLEAADLGPNDLVLEVGPGRGILTKQLLRRAGYVVAVEVDRTLAADLPVRCGAPANLQVVAADILRQDVAGLVDAGRTGWAGLADAPAQAAKAAVSVVANLPFYLTAPLVERFQRQRFLFRRLVLMVQMEVAERWLAPPGDPAYGVPSVTLSFAFEMQFVSKIPARAFHPQPKVDAAVVRLDPRPLAPDEVALEEPLHFAVGAAFGQRRKTMREALGRALAARHATGRADGRAAAEAALAEAGVEAGARAETLGLDEFLRLARALRGK